MIRTKCHKMHEPIDGKCTHGDPIDNHTCIAILL